MTQSAWQVGIAILLGCLLIVEMKDFGLLVDEVVIEKRLVV